MYDLHTHTTFSDGDLCPAELAQRCMTQGYRGLVITDHCDHALVPVTVPRLAEFCEAVRGHYKDLKVLPGCELTHVPPELIAELAARARELGAMVVLVHGETIVEPVREGTNRAAIEAGVDVVAHPGLISPEDVALAAARGVRLELSGRQGHCYANGHVARLALEHGARLSFGSDGHTPGDYPTRSRAIQILTGAGLSVAQAEKVLAENARLFDRV
jgi:histidinol phosphatase-like PHP family hydrolase